MHRTLFTPAMIETFGACKRAYEDAYLKFTTGANSAPASVLCKKFVLRALSEINRGRLSTVNQVQKYMGQHWPVEKLEEQLPEKDKLAKAFLFVYKALIRYVQRPYRPEQAHVVSVALKVRARVAHVRVYVEDTLDLVLWYPDERRLEIVDFQLHALKPVDPAWPSPSILVKYFLADKLKVRWPFERLTLTQYRVGTQEFAPLSINLEESLFRLHWSELVKTIDEMKDGSSEKGKVTCAIAEKGYCSHCQALSTTPPVEDNLVEVANLFKMSA